MTADRRRRRFTGTVLWHRGAGRWMAQFRCRNGARVTQYFNGRPPPNKPWKRDPRPPEALRWLDEIRRDDELGIARPTDITVGEQIAEWARLRWPSLTESTRQTYGNMLALMEPLMPLRLVDMRANHVQAWINGLLVEGKAPKTVQLARVVLNQAMEAAWNWERITRNPVKYASVPNVKPVHERRAWSAKDARKLLTSTQDSPYHALWTLLLYTGLRQGEARALRWDDVSFPNRTITVAASMNERGTTRGPRKTKDRLIIPMVAPLEQALQRMPRSLNYVFTSESGQPLTGNRVRRLFTVACRQAGLEPLLPHELRHTAGTLLADAGVPLLTVASILGHSTTKMLSDTYYHSGEDERRKALEMLSKRLSG